MKEKVIPIRTVNIHTNAFITKFAVLNLVGLIILIMSLIADLIGLGEGQGFGKSQIAGVIVGAVIFAVGLYMMHKRNFSRIRNIHNDKSIERGIELKGQVSPSEVEEVNDLEISP
jgi:membrane-bound ClpP family serine protease